MNHSQATTRDHVISAGVATAPRRCPSRERVCSWLRSWPPPACCCRTPLPQHVVRPARLNVGQSRDDFGVGQDSPESWHPRFVILEVGGFSNAEFRYPEKQRVRVGPGVTAFVVRRRRKDSILVLRFPLGLTFEVPAMARGAMRHVNGLAAMTRASSGLRIPPDLPPKTRPDRHQGGESKRKR